LQATLHQDSEPNSNSNINTNQTSSSFAPTSPIATGTVMEEVAHITTPTISRKRSFREAV